MILSLGLVHVHVPVAICYLVENHFMENPSYLQVLVVTMAGGSKEQTQIVPSYTKIQVRLEH